MTPSAPTPATAPASGIINLRGTANPQDTRKKAHARISERIDPVRNRHKPLSLLRADAKKLLEQVLDQEGLNLSRVERDRWIEDVLAESFGLSPLDEIFRDEAVKEIVIIDSGWIVGKKNDSWQPVNARFRDTDQLRVVLARWAEVAESYVPGTSPQAGFDVRLPNGFRAMAVVPPEVLQTPPQVLLVRGAPEVGAVVAPAPLVAAGSGVSAMSGVYRSIATTPAPRVTNQNLNALGQPSDKPESGIISLGAPAGAPTYSGGPSSGANLKNSGMQTGLGMNGDPNAKIRQKLTERIIGKFAAAGVYDLNSIPFPELQRIIMAQVSEMITNEKLAWDQTMQERITLEILAGMNR
ncbi:MAG: hypothetical protein ACRC8S_20635 [Fimbriiglobus sp.]